MNAPGVGCAKAGWRYPPDSDFLQLPQKVRKKTMTARRVNSQEIKSDFNSKMLSFDRAFASHWTCLESLNKNPCSVDCAIHMSYNRALDNILQIIFGSQILTPLYGGKNEK